MAKKDSKTLRQPSEMRCSAKSRKFQQPVGGGGEGFLRPKLPDLTSKVTREECMVESFRCFPTNWTSIMSVNTFELKVLKCGETIDTSSPGKDFYFCREL